MMGCGDAASRSCEWIRMVQGVHVSRRRFLLVVVVVVIAWLKLSVWTWGLMNSPCAGTDTQMGSPIKRMGPDNVNRHDSLVRGDEEEEEKDGSRRCRMVGSSSCPQSAKS